MSTNNPNIEIIDGITIRKNQDMFEEKYRPSTIEECILPKSDKKVFQRIIKEGSIPHILLHSELPGTGKTTTARALCEEMGVDYIFYNGSNVTVDIVRNEFPKFATTSPAFGSRSKKKAIILDEFDRRELRGSQELLRSFMNTYADKCSVIITGNNINGIIDPIIERCRNIQFGSPSKEEQIEMRKEMFVRISKICDLENITYDRRVLATLVAEKSPNMRSITSAVQLYSQRNDNHIDNGILNVTVAGDTSVVDEVITALKNKNFGELMKLSILFAPSYQTNIIDLQDKLYQLLTPESKLEMISTTSVNNSFIGLCGHDVVHVRGLFRDLLPLTFKD